MTRSLAIRVERMARRFYFGMLIFLLLSSVSFSSLLWQKNIGGEATTAPLLFQGKVAIGSQDGNIYALNPETGQIAWKVAAANPAFLIEQSDGLVAFSRDGKVTGIDRNGKQTWSYDFRTFNVTKVYGIGTNSKGMYVATDNGIYKFIGGIATLVYAQKGRYTVPAVEENSIVFAIGKNLTKIDLTGKIQWVKEMDADIWTAYPVISGQTVYYGSLDNKMHAISLSGGYEKWNVVGSAWVLTPPLSTSSTVYFADNSGYIYSINSEIGNVNWKTKLASSSMDEPVAGLLGGESVIFISSTDGSVYALKQTDGSVIWKSTATDRVGKPLFNQNKLIVGSFDSYVYAYSTDRACSITSPVDGAKAGYKEVIIRGTSVSRYSGKHVFVDINGAGSYDAEIASDGSWQYIINPQESFNEGINSISCYVSDSGGRETGSHTTISVLRDSAIPLDSFVVRAVPSSPLENEKFSVYVLGKSDGLPVDRFAVKVKETGKEYPGDGSINITLEKAGRYTLEVNKIGYSKGTAYVDVASKQMNQIYLIAGGILVLILLWLLYTKVISRLFARR